ncbi:class I SAM-dependent methyltransferase [Stomatobaculum sp. F0698]|uniref:tRNA (adenine(22)-N(1))-methyltransferase n=1 Tax=Stomatobaculum sp. F0698 TaxID=3059030 RepID=UPI00272CA26A|nr:class I SAM-dependent methyltransferase [Stomatobaculum sp. F0698]WLD87626.1 class I SAM-dependent methyltransferase [Stomatobaculum sp. F0698]
MGEERLKLSERLRALAELVPAGSVLADIGTDHAWVPAELLLKGRISRAVAMDIGEGPLARAEAHIAELGLTEQVSLRLSDGFAALKPGEADCVLIAGMGGELMQGILTRGLGADGRPGPAFRVGVKRYLFSPHTEWEAFRSYLSAQGFRLTDERMLKEDGKYYLILVCENGDGEAAYLEAEARGIPVTAARHFGPLLLERRDTVLRDYMNERLRKEQEIAERLPESQRTAVSAKREELRESIRLLKECLAHFEE